MNTKVFFPLLLMALLTVAGCSQENKKDPNVAENRQAPSPVAADKDGDSPQQSNDEATEGAFAIEEGGCAPIMMRACEDCHYLARVCQRLGEKNKRSWKRTIKRMVKNGAKITYDEQEALVECLFNQSEDVKAICQ